MPATLPTPLVRPLEFPAASLRPQPRDLPLIGMGLNELPYPPPPAAVEAAAGAAAGANRYSDPVCVSLRTALANAYDLAAGDLLCGNGAEELLDVVARTFVRPGDQILIPQFGYIQFAMIANRIGAELVKAPEPNYAVDVDGLLGCVGEKTKLVFLATPNNPTAAELPPSEAERLAAALPDHVVLVLDLAYAEFAGWDYCAAMHELVARHPNVMIIRTFSKAFGLAGLRLGWCHARPELIPSLYAVRGLCSVNAAAQAAGEAALGEMAYVQSCIDRIASERARIVAGLEGMGLSCLSGRTNFVLASFDGEAKSVSALIDHLYDDAGIILRPTREAGLEAFLRITVGTKEQNDQLLESVRGFVGSP